MSNGNVLATFPRKFVLMEEKKTTMLNLMPQPEEVSTDDKNLALFSHIGTFFGGFLVPLLVWLAKKDESSFVKEHAKESLNFQLSLMIYMMCGVILIFAFGLGILVLMALTIFSIWVTIKATIEASAGRKYHYPMCISFIQ